MKDAHDGGFLAVEMVWLCLTSCYLQALIVWRTQIGSGRQTTNHGFFIGMQWSVIHSRQAQGRDAYQFSIGQS
jgi:hypothetical protein